MKRVSFLLGVAFAVVLGGTASAQWSGQGDAGPGGHGHHGQGAPQSASDSSAPAHRPPRPRPAAADQVVITGVVKSLGPEADRVTIAYDPVEALNWPAGTTPFVVTDPALLSGVAVGQKVRFKLESAHIYDLERLP